MEKKIVISEDDYESRCAILEDGILSEIFIERDHDRNILSNIYKGRVENVLPGMQIAFVEIGLNRHAFLHVSDINHNGQIDEDGETTRLYLEDDDSASTKPRRKRRDVSITDLIQSGQNIVVQVTKEAMGRKGARVTNNVSLPGQFLVYLPNSSNIGISRRIDSPDERHRLRKITQKLRSEIKGGFIIRTAAESKTHSEFETEINNLVNRWEAIMKRAGKVRTPNLLHSDLGFAGRIIRDRFNKEIDELIIDSKEEYKKAVKFIGSTLPEFVDRISFYDQPIPITEAYEIEKELRKALGEKVWLKSGGYIIIQETEAMVSIDVNTGKFIGKTDANTTILKANLEATEEVARQMRLRDLGGIIVIDFIDMERHDHRMQVFKMLQNEIKKDRAKTNILHISELGLVEMTRQRTRPSLSSMLTEVCPYCEGHGFVLATDTIVINVLRKIERASRLSKKKRLKVVANELIVSRLLDQRSRKIEKLEKKLGIKITVEGDIDLHLEDFQLFDNRNRPIILD